MVLPEGWYSLTPVPTEPATEPNVPVAVPVGNNFWASYNQEPGRKLRVYPQRNGTVLFVFWCPACRETHTFNVGRGGWCFNGDMEYPSFSPSLRYDACHLILRDGVIEYCGDCWHDLRNKDVPLRPF